MNRFRFNGIGKRKGTAILHFEYLFHLIPLSCTYSQSRTHTLNNIKKIENESKKKSQFHVQLVSLLFFFSLLFCSMILITQSRLRSIFLAFSRALLGKFSVGSNLWNAMSFNFGSYLYISQMDLLRPRKKIDILRLMLSLLLSSHFHLFTSSFILLNIEHTLTFVLFIFLFFGKGARKIFHFRKSFAASTRFFA